MQEKIDENISEIQIPKIFMPLFEEKKYRFKIYEGGRGAGKSETFARALLIIACQRQVRILCTREIQDSIQDSVYKTLKDIVNLYVDPQSNKKHIFEDFDFTLTSIKNRRTGSEFIFCGLKDANKIKSMANIDICWVEEAAKVSKRSLEILIPTIRKENSEIWFSFNRDTTLDPVFEKFCLKESPDILHKKVNWYDNPFFPEVLNKDRLRDKENLSPEDYAHIWEGMPASNVDATYYGYYMHIAEANHRICGAVYDPSLDVHTAWDLGIGDATAIWFFQIYGNEIKFIDYYESHGRGMEWYANTLRDKSKEYNYHYGLHFAPHDVRKRNFGREAITTFEVAHRMGIEFEILYRSGLEEGIQRVRTNFNRCYFDKEFCKDGIACLKNYKKRFNVQKNTYEEDPYHDEYSHGADAFRYAIQATELISKNTGKPKSYEEIQDEFATEEPERDEITGY